MSILYRYVGINETNFVHLCIFNRTAILKKISYDVGVGSLKNKSRRQFKGVVLVPPKHKKNIIFPVSFSMPGKYIVKAKVGDGKFFASSSTEENDHFHVIKLRYIPSKRQVKNSSGFPFPINIYAGNKKFTRFIGSKPICISKKFEYLTYGGNRLIRL